MAFIYWPRAAKTTRNVPWHQRFIKYTYQSIIEIQRRYLPDDVKNKFLIEPFSPCRHMFVWTRFSLSRTEKSKPSVGILSSMKLLTIWLFIFTYSCVSHNNHRNSSSLLFRDFSSLICLMIISAHRHFLRVFFSSYLCAVFWVELYFLVDGPLIL